MISGIDSTVAKVNRATEHFESINRAISGMATGADSYEIVKDADGNEEIKFLVDPPPEIAILAGEIVYQLRSALDHLAFDLVKLNPTGIKLPENWGNKCDFPLWLRIPRSMIKCGHTAAPLPYNCFADTLPGISKAAFTFIELVQPYRSGPGIHNVMRILAQLSNIDRHRYLNVTLPKAAVHYHVKFASGIEGVSTVGGLHDGAKIHPFQARDISPDKAVEVERSFSTYITFDEPTVGSGSDTREVEFLLESCLEKVKRLIIPAFIDLLKNS